MTTYLQSLTIPSSIFENQAASVLLPVALGAAVGYGTRPTEVKKTYMALKQPPLHPPSWVFGPVWTVLYAVMGYGAHRVASAGLSALAAPSVIENTRHAMSIYSLQLGINLIWMPLFFVAKRPVEASVDIVTLLGLNGYLTYLYSGIDETAAWLQVPYLGWLSFATYLCVGAGHLNKWDFNGKDLKRS